MKISPETFPIIMCHEPAASNAVADTAQEISLKNADGCLIVVSEYTAGGDTDLVLTVHEGATAAVAAAGTYAISATFPIWVNTSAIASDTWVRQTDAASYTIDATLATPHLVAFYIPASILTDGRPFIQLGTSGGNAGNIVSALYILDGARYQQSTPPTSLA